ncbi:hypothetical protein K443DRAFT_685139, partial [Laccaria amethystina LaAM-08-1]
MACSWLSKRRWRVLLYNPTRLSVERFAPTAAHAAFWSSSMLKGTWWGSRSARGYLEDLDPSRVYYKLA